MRARQGEDYVLFCLDGVGRSHVVAGDVAALARRQGTSEPPVAFSVADRQEETDGQQLAQTGQGGKKEMLHNHQLACYTTVFLLKA